MFCPTCTKDEELIPSLKIAKVNLIRQYLFNKMNIESPSLLNKFLEKEILACNGLIVFQTGHFALVYSKKESKLIPAIYQDINNKEQKDAVKSHPYMGVFPLESWKIGLGLAGFAIKNSKQARIAIVANDWQWIPKAEAGTQNPLREEFYKSNALPQSYKKILEKNHLEKELIMPMIGNNGKTNHQLFFGEQKLRNLYSRKYSKICNLKENLCAQEYVPFLDQVAGQKAKLLISFVPKTCQIPINAGSREMKKVLNSDIKIINLFSSGTNKQYFYKHMQATII